CRGRRRRGCRSRPWQGRSAAASGADRGRGVGGDWRHALAGGARASGGEDRPRARNHPLESLRKERALTVVRSGTYWIVFEAGVEYALSPPDALSDVTTKKYVLATRLVTT